MEFGFMLWNLYLCWYQAVNIILHQNNLYEQSIYQQLYLQFYFTPFVFIPTCTATMTSSSLSGPVLMFSYSHTKIIK